MIPQTKSKTKKPEPVSDPIDDLAARYEKQEWELLNHEERILCGRLETAGRIILVLVSVGLSVFTWTTLFRALGDNPWQSGTALVSLMIQFAIIILFGISWSALIWNMANTYAEYRTAVKKTRNLKNTQEQRQQFLRTYELMKADPDFKAAMQELTRRNNFSGDL